MSTDRNLDHDFLTLRIEDQADRTFLGGLRLGARSRIFVLAGLVVLAAIAGLYVTVDRRVSGALDGLGQSRQLAAAAARVETGIAGARSQEKRFLLEKDPLLADGFRVSLEKATDGLDALSKMEAAEPLRQHIATIRDGLAQYDQQFTKLVDQERALGLTDGSGLTAKLKDATETLKARFATAGYGNLAGQVARINQQGQETLRSGFKVGVEEIQKRYETLAAFLKETKIPAETRKELQALVDKHETSLLAMINSRFSFDEESQRFDEIVAYLSPSLISLTRFPGVRQAKAEDAFEQERRLARIALAAGAAVALVFLVAIGMVLMGSLHSTLRRLAAAAERLADGDRAVGVPGRGNSDSTGTIARSLDRWLDTLADLDQVRQELDLTRARLENALADAESAAQDAAETARAALLADEEDERPPADAGPSRYGPLAQGGPEPPLPANRGPISSVSRQLTSFSEYVTAAANDVERTEALIRGLDDATREIGEMGAYVTAIRDQTNLLAFRSGARGPGADNVVPLAADDRERAAGEDADADMAKRFDAIREATDRAERTMQSVRTTLADVTKMGREIAATASEQALEATHKLLSQSEYLQNMLDDVIAKIQPAPPGAMTERGRPPAKGKDPKTARWDDKD